MHRVCVGLRAGLCGGLHAGPCEICTPVHADLRADPCETCMPVRVGLRANPWVACVPIRAWPTCRRAVVRVGGSCESGGWGQPGGGASRRAGASRVGGWCPALRGMRSGLGWWAKVRLLPERVAFGAGVGGFTRGRSGGGVVLVGLMVVIRATCSHVVAFTDVPGASTVKPAVPEK
ncbi:hypothetical protein GCM10027203_42600 [Nonomuraea fastidiosa]